MKIAESAMFKELCRATLKFYEEWTDESIGASKRAIVAGANESRTVCMVLFKGNEADCLAIKKLLDRRDKNE